MQDMQPKPIKRFRGLDFKPTVLVEQVSRVLSDAIMEGTLKGGEQLIEDELRREFGISRSPLREAFRDLEKKGLVEIVPRRGTFVKAVTRKDIEEHFPVRAALEGLAAREALAQITAEDIMEIEETLHRMTKAAQRKDAKTYREHHLLFHEIFINASGNDLLIRVLQTLRMHNMWYRLAYRYYKEDFDQSLQIHHEILEMFRDPDTSPLEIERTVRNHIEIHKERFLLYLQQQEELAVHRS
jgi:DNA-binding GntR family transcriptional regulator